MESHIDNNQGLGYAAQFVAKNADAWRKMYPDALVTVIEFGRKWAIVIDRAAN